MLILKAPIELKNRSNFIHDGEVFYNRISSNYSLMGMDVTHQDLLHAVTSPPEIFIQEGNVTTVAGNTVISSRNEEKLEVFNNLLNRILVSVNAPLTYQDRVYISDVLYRMGVKNDRLFMEEVSRIKQENSTTNNLINLLLGGGDEARDEALRQYVSNFIENVSNREERQVNEVNESGLALSIMNRLKTGAIYQILSNFNTNIHDSYINRNEFSISEQSYTARQLLTERLMERLTGERGELVYRSENVYEEELMNEEQENNEVTNNITSAVLLDLVRNLYNMGSDRMNVHNSQWYEFRDILYNSSENTLSRLNYISTDNFITSIEATTVEGVRLNFQPTGELKETEELSVQTNEVEEIRRQVERVEEYNAKNVERYQKMLSIIERAQRGRGRVNGEERTRRASREILNSGPETLRAILEEGEAEAEQQTVFNEIQRLFPDDSARIFNIIQEYMQNGGSTVNNNISVVRNDLTSLVSDIERVREESERVELVLKESDSARSEAAEEIKRLSDRTAAAKEERRTEGSETPGIPIVHRSNEALTLEEIEETLQNYRQSRDVNREDSESVTFEEERTRSVSRQINENASVITQRDREDIAALVNQGVRSQMNAISNEVMSKLENRLRNEKSRRGI
ncbi:MAG: hypothetical protein J6O71_03665 [Lachnospiraceae bacterium]|nr:hypothetical protein [Lachnospiraceae bacterium]